jgi:hypothetical protein
MATAVQPDAGARIVDHAIVKVYEMLGKLTGSSGALQRRSRSRSASRLAASRYTVATARRRRRRISAISAV